MADPEPQLSADVAARLLAATEVLEAVVADRMMLESLTLEERTRFLAAAGDAFCPDITERRQRTRARLRKVKADKLQRDESILAATGIRTLRNKDRKSVV